MTNVYSVFLSKKMVTKIWEIFKAHFITVWRTILKISNNMHSLTTANLIKILQKKIVKYFFSLNMKFWDFLFQIYKISWDSSYLTKDLENFAYALNDQWFSKSVATKFKIPSIGSVFTRFSWIPIPIRQQRRIIIICRLYSWII